MTTFLTTDEIEDLTRQVHEAQAEQAQAAAERDADPTTEVLAMRVAEAKLALDNALKASAEAAQKYDERIRLAKEREDALRSRILAGWPVGEGKTIGYATVATRRTCALRHGVDAVKAFRMLDVMLGTTGALPKIVVGIKIDPKAALPLLDAMPNLGEVLSVEESRSLTIRQPKEA